MTTYAVRGKGDFHPSHYHQVSDGAVSGGGNVYYASDDTLASTTNQTFRNQLRNNHKSISVYYTSSFQCYDNSNNRLNTRQSVFPSTSNHPFCLDHVVNQYNLSRYHDGVRQVTGDDRKPISCRSMTRVNQDSVKDRINYNNNNKENDINNSKCMKLSVNKDKIDLMQNCNFRGTNKNSISNPLIERQNEVNNRLLSIHCELENNKTKHNSEIFYSNIDPKLYLTSSIPVIEHNSTSFHNNNNNPVEDSKGMVHSHLPDDTHSDDTASLHNHNQNTDHDINAAEARHLLRFPPLLSPLLVEVQQRVPLARVWGANRYHQTQLLLAAGFSKTEVEVILWELRRLIRNTSTECVC
ncbi:hypothetical protein ADEAN_000822300 [Angomonas deanei]|uniref:Uncharacterized protein n=1 Tax=Angomonas deanei TaxID=59799 RepID=A0A7G2CP28_9TRYP|nr:hypothetical protein ADEAN_000822300 [Angomonas deanei]